MSDTPEAQARKNIDGQLEACGWVVQNGGRANIPASLGMPVREFPHRGGDAPDCP